MSLLCLQAASSGFAGEVWSTYSLVSGWLFGIVLAADFSAGDSMSLTPAEAGWGTAVSSAAASLALISL